jgi:hypothetical protein
MVIKRTNVNFADPAARRDWLRRLQARAANRARKAGLRFTLTPDFAVQLYEQQHGRCAVSGIEFSLESYPKALVKHPFAPSIDRTFSDGDYTPDNVRLVCVAVNFGMGQWGQELYMTIARAAVDREAKEQNNPDPAGDADWHVRQKEKIAAAEALRDSAPVEAKPGLTRRIAALKRNLKLGPEGLRLAACRARKSRQERTPIANRRAAGLEVLR